MTKEKSFSINDLANISLFEMIILQLLLRHSQPLVRHGLYQEINHFFQLEDFKKKKFTEEISGSEILFYNFLKENRKTFSTSSFYNSLENLEKMGLLSYKRDKKGKVKTVKKNQNTLKAVNVLQQHFLRTGLTTEYDSLRAGASQILKMIGNNQIGSILLIWLYEYVETILFKFLSSISNSVFIICDENLFETMIKDKYPKYTHTRIKNKLIREPNDVFDLVLYFYVDIDISIFGMERKSLLKESVRVTKKGGHIVIVNYKKLNDTEDPAINRLIYLFNSANRHELSNEGEFKKDLSAAGISEMEIFTDKFYIFGLGKIK